MFKNAKHEKHSDIAALFAEKQDSADKIKSLKQELRQSHANLALKQNSGQKASKAPSNKSPRALYSWEAQYGPSKSFESREEFFECLYKDPASGKKQKIMAFTGISILTADAICVTKLDIAPRNPLIKYKLVHVVM